MAVAKITQRWPEGGELVCEVSVEENYPDAVREVCVRVVETYRECVPDTEDTEAE